MGALTHSAVGLPAVSTVAPYIEKALAKSFMLQPYRRDVKVRLRRIPRRPRLYRYGTVSPENVEAEVVVEYGSARVRARMGYVKELKYPLMYVVEATGRRDGASPHP